MTATPRELAHASSLRSALAELNNAAIEARPHVKAVADQYLDGNTAGGGLRAVNALDRLDGAIADAGDVLSRVAS